MWALLTPATQPPPQTPMREVLAGLRDPRIATGMWIVILVGLMFGTLDVLAPLRLDELGASAARDRGDVRGVRRARGVDEPVRRPPLGPPRPGAAAASSAWAPRASRSRCCRGRRRWLLLVALVIVTGPSIGILWTPSMAMISDGADGVGIDQGYAVALINLAWSTGQTLGSAGGARLGQAYGDALPYLMLARPLRGHVRRARPPAAPATALA